jgi:thiol-disulfide isomerase/thioredoxin
MKTLRSSLAFAAALAAASFSFAADDAKPVAPTAARGAAANKPADPPVTLHIGDPAPPITVAKWLKGTPVLGFEKGKVYVVECWATWCGPCRASMPHLSALARKYAGKATFMGVDVWELAHAKKTDADYVSIAQAFVNNAKEMMDYNVAADTSGARTGAMASAWMSASGAPGIPTAFVVDKEGRIGWFGHPAFGLDEAVACAIDDKLDAAAVEKINADAKSTQNHGRELIAELQAAEKAGDNAKVIALSDEVMKAWPLANSMAITSKYMALYASDPKAAATFAREMMVAHADAPLDLYGLADRIVSDDAKRGDYDIAISLMKTVMEHSSMSDPMFGSIYAKAFFKNGNAETAAMIQGMVVNGYKDSPADVPQKTIDEAAKLAAAYKAAIPAPTLHVGDPAPALVVGKWLKGTPVQAFEKGKVYVVECWATWCGPCRGAMPHLSELAKKYAGKATFIGVAVWQLAETEKKDADYMPVVESFVSHAHDMMAYNVAVDTSGGNDGAMAKTWLKAAGRNGIPCSFVIDQQGRIAWIGHPQVGLDEAVGLAIEGRLDAAAVAKLDADQKELGKRSSELNKRLQVAQKDGNNAEVIAAADELLKAAPSYAVFAVPAKYLALQATDPKAAAAYAHEVIATYGNAPVLLNSIANRIVDDNARRSDYGTAVALMDAVFKCSDPSDPNFMGTYAKALFKSGDAARAVTIQKQAVEALHRGVIDWPQELVDKANQTLKDYQAALEAKT